MPDEILDNQLAHMQIIESLNLRVNPIDFGFRQLSKLAIKLKTPFLIHESNRDFSPATSEAGDLLLRLIVFCLR